MATPGMECQSVNHAFEEGESVVEACGQDRCEGQSHVSRVDAESAHGASIEWKQLLRHLMDEQLSTGGGDRRQRGGPQDREANEKDHGAK